MNRPAPVKCAHVRLSVVRGPDADGRWYWRARVSSGGERSMPWSGWATVEEAEVKAGALAQPSAAPPPDPTVRTLSDLMETWTGHQRQREKDGAIRPATMSAYRGSARTVKYAHPTLPVGRLVSPDVLQGIQRALLEQGAAASSAAKAMLTLRLAWAWAVEEGLVQGRLPKIKPPKGRRVYSRATPERDDVARVLDALEPDSWAWRMTFLLAATGARRGEIASLTWARVYLEEGVIEVHGKTGPREVPIGPGVVAELRRWREGATVQWVTGPPGGIAALWRALRRACLAVGVRPFSAQGLRRAATVALYRAGLVDLESRVLGHSPAVAARDYREVLQQDRQAVHDVLDFEAHRAQRAGTVAKKPG